MPASFDYALLRVVPRVERQEFVNAGVVVFCREKRYLAARVRLNRERVQVLWPEADLDLIAQHLDAVVRICQGDPAAGAIARRGCVEKTEWMTGRSTRQTPGRCWNGT